MNWPFPSSAAQPRSTHAPVTGLPQFRVVLLQIDNLLLMLPQNEVRSVESRSQIQPLHAQMRTDTQVLGSIPYAGHDWPVYSFDARFQLLEQAPETRRACVLLHVGEHFFGLLCDDARVLNAFDGQVHALPTAMHVARTPVTGLLLFENRLTCVSNVARLAALLPNPQDLRSAS